MNEKVSLEKNASGQAPAANQPGAKQPAAKQLPADALIIVPMRNTVLFPGVISPITVGRPAPAVSRRQDTSRCPLLPPGCVRRGSWASGRPCLDLRIGEPPAGYPACYPRSPITQIASGICVISATCVICGCRSIA